MCLLKSGRTFLFLGLRLVIIIVMLAVIARFVYLAMILVGEALAIVMVICLLAALSHTIHQTGGILMKLPRKLLYVTLWGTYGILVMLGQTIPTLASSPSLATAYTIIVIACFAFSGWLLAHFQHLQNSY